MSKKAKHAGKIDFKKVKISFIALIFASFFFVVIYRLFDIQILNREFYLGKLKRQYENTLSRANVLRGEIYDRNNVELASSVLTFSLYVRKNNIKDINKFSMELSKITKTPDLEIRKKIENEENKGFFLLRRCEDEGIKEKLKMLKKKTEYKDVFDIIDDYKRFYPYKELASHILGFVDEDNKGLEGVEYFFDSNIRGGFKKTASSSDITEGILRKGNFIKEGHSVVLSIDKDIQAIVEDELKKGVLKAQAKSGFVVVADPNTGEILAIASYPTFDPNNFKNYTPQERKNRAILDIYEPGSVFKVFVVAAALEEKVVGPKTTVFCENGHYKVHDRVFKEAHRKKYGYLTVEEVVCYSSNIGSAKIAEKVGKRKLYDYLINFGFGKKSGLGFTGESKGIVPTLKELTPVRFTTVAFGQGISINPVQTTMAFSAVVNGGYLLSPILVKKIVNEDGNVVYEKQKEIIRRVISQRTSDTLKSMLRKVVTYGTGKEAAIDGTTVIGKTGTAQKAGNRGYTDKYFASFIGAFPEDRPKYVIYVGVDSPKGIAYGGYVAGPIFREIGKRIIDLLGEERSSVILSDTNMKVTEKRVEVYQNITSYSKISGEPDFRGLALREAIRVANLKKIKLEIVGSGTVYHQEPVYSSGGEKKLKVYLQ